MDTKEMLWFFLAATVAILAAKAIVANAPEIGPKLF